MLALWTEYSAELFTISRMHGKITFFICVVLLLKAWPDSFRAVMNRLAEAAVLIVSWIALDFLLYLLSPLWRFRTIASEMLVMFLYAWLRCSYPMISRIVYSTVYYAAYMLLTGEVAAIGYTLDTFGTFFGLPFSVYFAVLLSLLPILLLRRRPIESFTDVPKAYIALIVGVSLVGLFQQMFTMDSFTIEEYTDKIKSFTFFLNLGFLVLMYLAYMLFYWAASEYSRSVSALADVHRREVETEVLAAAQHSFEELQEIRHEIKNHDAYMHALLKAGDYDKLEEYFESSVAAHKEAVHFVHSGNREVDIVVNNRITRAKLLGVRLETILAVPPELPYEGEDICSLISNLADNALEGCAASGVPEEERRVLLSIQPKGGYLFFRTENPVHAELAGEERPSLKTTKENKELHGYGTGIIRKITEKYNGTAKFRVKNGVFIADAMLELDMEGTN